MSGALSIFLLYTFKAWTATTSPFYLSPNIKHITIYNCTGPCGNFVWVQVTHYHKNNNSFNKPTWSTYNINFVYKLVYILEQHTYLLHSPYFNLEHIPCPNICTLVAGARSWISRLFIILCVNVYCTTATVCQHNCSWQIYRIIYHNRDHKV